MSYGQVVHMAVADKDARRRELTAKEAEREARYARAYDLCCDRVPDLHDGREGRPCPWAVWALLDLWRRHGEGNVTASQIRRERSRRLAAHRDKYGYDPYDLVAA